MLAQNYMPVTSNLFGKSTGSIAFRGKQTSTGFDLMLDKLKAPAAGMNAVTTSSVKPLKQKSDNSTAQKAINIADTKQKTDSSRIAKNLDESRQTVKASIDKSTANIDKTEANNTAMNETDDKTEAKLVDDSLLERIATLITVVSDVVMDKLGLSPEELDKLLSEQNMTALDLLNNESLQKLVLANSGEDNVLALLTNEDLVADLKDLNNLIDSMIKEANLPIGIDELKEHVTDAESALVKNSATQGYSTDYFAENTSLDDYNSGIANSQLDEKSLSYSQRELDKSGQSDTKVSVGEDTYNTASEAEAVQNNQSSSGKGASDDGADLKDMNPFQAFVDNMVKAVNVSTDGYNDSILQASDLREIANQVIDKIRISIKPEQTSLEMNLNPENLGKVNLTIKSKEGVITAHFVVENQISKEAIESQLSILRETLNMQGVKVEAIEVNVSAYAFEQNNNSNTDKNQSDSQRDSSGRHITIDEAMLMTEETPVEEYVNNELLDRQINYIA